MYVFWPHLLNLSDFIKIKKIGNSKSNSYKQLLLYTFPPPMNFIFGVLVLMPRILRAELSNQLQPGSSSRTLKSKNLDNWNIFKIHMYISLVFLPSSTYLCSIRITYPFFLNKNTKKYKLCIQIGSYIRFNRFS